MYSTSVPSRFHFTLFPFFPLSTLYLSCVFIVPSLLVADTGTIGDLSFSQARTFGFSGARDPHTPSLGCHSKESVLPHHTLFHSIHTTIIPMTVTRVFLFTSFPGTLRTSCRHWPNLKLIFLCHILSATSQRQRQGSLSTHSALLWAYTSSAPFHPPLPHQSLATAHSMP